MDEEDLDTHICLSCQATIVGLESYVQHKKFECPAKKLAPEKPVSRSNSTTAAPTYSSTLTSHAPSLVTSVEASTISDVVTTSAPLSVDVTPGVGASLASSMLSPTSTASASMLSHTMGGSTFSPTSSRVVDPNMILYNTRPANEAEPPVNWNEFFSSLELQSRGPVEKPKADPDAKDVKGMGDVQKDDPGYPMDSFESKTLRIVNLLNDLDFSSDSEGFLPSDAEDLLNFSDVEDMEDIHTGGKWKPGSHPSPSHTRGKWRPGTKPMQTHSRGKIRPGGKGRGKNLSKLEAFEKQRKETKETEAPRTGGKGKLLSRGKRPVNYTEDSTDEEDDFGKTEKELEKEPEPVLEPEESHSPDNAANESIPEDMVDAVPVPDMAEAENALNNALNNGSGWSTDVEKKFNSAEKKEKVLICIQCHVCNRTFNNKYRFVRHLASTYHIKREKVTNPPYILEESFQKLLLRQKPFQCRICSFFCNEASVLHGHMKSEEHADLASSLVGPLLCVRCKFSCQTNEEMLQHLSLAEHEKKITETRQPCIIKEIRKEVACPTCKVVKHSAMALAKHMKVSHGRCLDKVELRKYRRKAGIFSRLCPHCGKTCANNQVLALHIRRRHTSDRPYRCTHCDVGYAESVGLRIHLRSKQHALTVAELGNLSVNSPRKPRTKQQVKCRFCDFRSESTKEIRSHTILEHPDRVQYCDLCGVSFDKDNLYERHLKGRLHKRQMEKSQCTTAQNETCEVCGKRFYDPRQLRMHAITHTQVTTESKLKELAGDPMVGIDPKYHAFARSMSGRRDGRTVECPECKAHLRVENMISHLRKHSGSLPFACIYCEKRFTSAYYLNRHLKTHFGLDNFKCKYCSKEFRQKLFLRTHLLRHHKDPEITKAAHYCQICNMGYIHKNQLVLHMQRHTGKRIKCTWPGCKLTFVQPSEREAHMRTHTNVRPYLCDFCGYSAKMKNQLTRHRRRHTGERAYHCEYCTYKAINSTHLHRHMRIHIGTKPFKCPHCDYRCNTIENVRKHIKSTKRHAGLPIYPCKLCQYGTDSSKEFRDHLDEIHSINTKTTDIISVYSGLYEKETDIRKVPEGSQALPCRETRPNSAKSPDQPKHRNPRTELPVQQMVTVKDEANAASVNLSKVKTETPRVDHAYSTSGYLPIDNVQQYGIVEHVEQVEVETTPAAFNQNLAIYYANDDRVYLMEGQRN